MERSEAVLEGEQPSLPACFSVHYRFFKKLNMELLL
jgi:hypothetical protein